MSSSEKDKNAVLARRRMPATHVLVHYDEIALKGGNRRRFENLLANAMRTALRDVPHARVLPRYGRYIVALGEGVSVDAVVARLSRVFGIARLLPAARAEPSLDDVKRRLAGIVDGIVASGEPPASFGIVTHRVRKDLPFRSLDANRELGSLVVERTGWKVHLDAPDLPILVWFVDNDAFIAFERVVGPGGLPPGAAGRVACLLSGGIDSPVACWRILKRGASAVFVHFHSAPRTSAASQDKVRELAATVLPYGQNAPLYMVPFVGTQERIVTECPAPLRVVLYRRFMMRAAEALARKEGALALVTGDSLGQVASQTLENLDTIGRAVTLPILRPLIGMHKGEIVDDARRIGTYETSIEPHDDCCSFLMPRNPSTQAKARHVESAETALDVEAEVRTLVESAERESIQGAFAASRKR